VNAQVSIQHTPTAPHPRGRLGWRRLLVAPLAVLALLCVAAPAQAYIYWGTVINGYSGTIGRANLDGTGVNQSFITTAGGLVGVAVDGAHIYWTNYGNDTTVARTSTARTSLRALSPACSKGRPTWRWTRSVLCVCRHRRTRWHRR